MTPLMSTALLRTQADGRLVALAADGSERAFEVLVERYRRPLRPPVGTGTTTMTTTSAAGRRS